MYMEQIDIYETYNSGGVVTVSALDEDGQRHILWNVSQPSRIQGSRIFSPPFTVSSVFNVSNYSQHNCFIQGKRSVWNRYIFSIFH